MTRNIHPLAAAILLFTTSIGLSACAVSVSKGDAPGVGEGGTPPPKPQPPRYAGVEDNVLIPTGVKDAQDAGFTGKGVKLAILDGFTAGAYAPLDARKPHVQDFTDPPTMASSIDATGRGSVAAAIAAGLEAPGFKGGVAQDAELYLGRVCDAVSCSGAQTSSAIWQFASQGVRIFTLPSTTYDRADLAAAYGGAIDAIVRNDALAIAGTGNAGDGQGVSPAQLPVFGMGGADNWLAVASVGIDKDGLAGTLLPGTQACGAAKAFCLVAPGEHRVTPLPGDPAGTPPVVTDTAFSAAIVAGVAAQVWQAFPWMSASNVQQTLLTTAQDLGAPGVDSTYGWGMVDAAAAMNGPGSFNGTFSAAPGRGAASVFSNDISGTGGLHKQGAGTLALSGDNSYTGLTHVSDGTLLLTGRLASDVQVEGGATFASAGGRIDGRYTAGSNSTTAVQIGTGLSIGGRAELAGTLRLLAPADGYTVGGYEQVLAAGALSGRFADVTYANDFLWKAKLDYSTDRVMATLTRRSAARRASELGAAQSVVDGARQVDALIKHLDERATAGKLDVADPVVASATRLLGMESSEAADAFAGLTGQIHGTQRALVLQAALNDVSVSADRIPLLLATESSAVWAQAEDGNGEVQRSGYQSASYRTRGLTVGVDMPLPVGGGVAGVALTHSRTDGRMAGADGHLRALRSAATAYVAQPFGDGYVAGSVGYGGSDVETSRWLLAGADDHALSQRDDSTLGARIEVGHRTGALSPFVALGLLRFHQGAFTESAGSGLGLSARAQSQNVKYADLGVRHHAHQDAWDFDAGIVHRSVFGGRDTSFNAHFNGLEDAGFVVNGQNLSRDNTRVFFGARYQATPTLALNASVSAERGNGQSVVLATAGLHWIF